MAKKVNRESCSKTSHPITGPSAIASLTEYLPISQSYTIQPGDILRLKSPNAYCREGKYVVLSMDLTVCLARTKKEKRLRGHKKTGERHPTNELVYIQIADLCHFERTHKQVSLLSSGDSLPHKTTLVKEGTDGPTHRRPVD